MAIGLNAVINSGDVNQIVNTVKPMLPYIGPAAGALMTATTSLVAGSIWLGGGALALPLGAVSLIFGVGTLAIQIPAVVGALISVGVLH